MKKTALLLTLGLVTSCANLSTLQTARTVPPKTIEGFFGGGSYQSPQFSDLVNKATGSSEKLNLPYVEVGARYGIIDNLDVGAKITIIGTMAADAKYRLLSLGGFDIATGLSLGYLTISQDTKATTGSTTTATIIDTMVPLYVSFEPIEWFAIYASPKIWGRFVSGTTTTFATFYAATAGVKLGKNFGVMLEATQGNSLGGVEFSMTQVNAAFFFQISPPEAVKPAAEKAS
ncbi:MAG: hypothetical protein HYR96_04365 [Deltaproteobacteria bacterium]|nr:hypothetical protein [Deltaproteobacteria bacterium]MBI3295414.1 hypothetical protein [Deltaproteobacteria bacterium]